MSLNISAESFILQDREADIDKTKIVYGPELGAPAAGDEDDDGDKPLGSFGTRLVKAGYRVSLYIFRRLLGFSSLVIQPFYTADEIRSFRTMGLEPGEHKFPENIVRFIIHRSTNKRNPASWIQGPQ